MYDAQEKYFRWLSVYDPTIHRETVRRLKGQRTLGNLGWVQLVVAAVGAAAGAVQKRKEEKALKAAAKKEEAAQKLAEAKANLERVRLITSNAERASRGLSPLNADGTLAAIPANYLPALAVGAGVLVLVLWRKRR